MNVEKTQNKLMLIILCVAMTFWIVESAQAQTDGQWEAADNLAKKQMEDAANLAKEAAYAKALEILALKAEMISTKDFVRIPRMYELSGELEEMCTKSMKRAVDDHRKRISNAAQRTRDSMIREDLYRRREISSTEYYQPMRRNISENYRDEIADAISTSVYNIMIRYAARMRLAIGSVHKEAGQFNEAKKTFRSIITDYTGESYKSLVHEAEFALVDLQDFEKEWNAKLEKEKLEKERLDAENARLEKENTDGENERLEKERIAKENEAKQRKSGKTKQSKKQQ